MNRFEFMRQLEMLLADITPNERNEALQFYNDYFDDAGAENEQDVINALGSPAKVASTIKADLTGNATGEFTETGYQDFYDKGQELVKYGQNVNGQNENGQAQGNTYQGGTYQGNAGQSYNYQNNPVQGNQNGGYQNNGSTKKGMSGGQLVLMIILCIFAAPILIPLAAGLFGLLIGVAAMLFGLFVAVAAVAFSMVIIGIVLLVVGIVKIFAAPFGGLCLAGTGLVCAGIGILFVIISVWVCSVVIPAVVRGIVNLCRMPFKKRRGEAV